MREGCVGDTVSRYAEDRQRGRGCGTYLRGELGMIGWDETAQATECGTNAFGSETPGGTY